MPEERYLPISAMTELVKSGTATPGDLRSFSLANAVFGTDEFVYLKIEETPHAAPQGDQATQANFAQDFNQFPLANWIEEGSFTHTPFGMLPNGGRTYHPDYRIGTRWYFEEAIIRVNQPFIQDHPLTYHAADYPAGQLWIIPVGSSGQSFQFEWRQANATGDAVLTYRFNNLTAPIGAADSVEYVYYWIERSGSTITLHVNGSEQSFVGVPTPLPVAGAQDDIHSIGSNQHGNVFLAWMWFRSDYSNSQDTPVSGSLTTWDDPVINENTIVETYGGTVQTYLDAGQDDEYWNNAELIGLDTTLGSVSARFAATNIEPMGMVSPLFSGTSIGMLPGPNSILVDGQIQGRYLVMQFTWLVDQNSSLQGGGPRQKIRNGLAFRAYHDSAPWTGTDPIQITLRVPPIPSGELPVTPDLGEQLEMTWPTNRVEFDARDVQAYRVGTRQEPQRYRIRWSVIDQAELDAIKAFWREKKGPEGAFFYRPFGGQDQITVSFEGELLRETKLAPGAYSLSLNLVERLF